MAAAAAPASRILRLRGSISAPSTSAPSLVQGTQPSKEMARYGRLRRSEVARVDYARRDILKRGATAIGVGLVTRATMAHAAQSTSPAVRMAQTPALDIGYEETGDARGFPVILLHGFPDDVRAYDEVIGPLARKRLSDHRPVSTRVRTDPIPRRKGAAHGGTSGYRSGRDRPCRRAEDPALRGRRI